MAKVLATHVHVQNEDGTSTILEAGSKVPDKYKDQVTNPAAYVDAAADPAEPVEKSSSKGSKPAKAKKEPKTSATDTDYGTWDYPRLKAEAKARELPQGGKTADLVARLQEDDAEKVKNPPASSSAAEDDQS